MAQRRFDLPYDGIPREFRQCKAKYPKHLLMFEVGDFYELFFEDAEEVSKVLGLRLASRFSDSIAPIPMCGVHRRDGEATVARLLSMSYSIAVASPQVNGGAE